MMQVSNLYIDEFRGYLKCIARLCAKGYGFGVAGYKADVSIDDFVSELVKFWGLGDEDIEPSNYQYLGREKVESHALFKEVESFVFNGLLDRSNMPGEPARNYATKMLTEDINEYYGLVSITLNEEGVFHPLLSSSVYVLDIRNSDFSKALYFVVKIEDIYVLTYFRKRSINALEI